MLSSLYSVLIYPLYLIIEFIFTFFYRITDIAGVSVIGVSIGITLLCLPLYAVAEHWQQVERDVQKKLAPVIQHIKSTFLGDERYMMTTAYYSENHYHPMMALRSSFGLLIQVPFFMAAYSYLSNLSMLQGESFLFIKDMGQPDAMFSIGGFAINVLPIAMTLINIVAGAIYTKGFPFKEKAQIYGMALIFLVILYNSPSGLVLYWTMNNVFSLVKNIFYKLKNPLKSFWLCMCACVAFAIIGIDFFTETHLDSKILLTILMSIVFFIPLLMKALSFILGTVFKNITENKKICAMLFFASALTMTVLAGLSTPSTIIASSPKEFSGIGSNPNPASFVWNSFFQAFGLFLFWPSCIYALFHNKKKVSAVFAIVFSCMALGALVNTFLFSGNYGDLSLLIQFDEIVEPKPEFLEGMLNLLAMAAVVLIFTLLARFINAKFLPSIFFILTLALSASSFMHMNTIRAGYTDWKKLSNTEVELKPAFHLSKTGKNVIVFMLDRMQNWYIPTIFEESPELYDTYSGFVLYQNTASFAQHTIMGAPPIYGGYEYTPLEINKRPDTPLLQKHNEALSVLPRIFDEQAGFYVNSADLSWANYSDFPPDMTFFSEWPSINAQMLYAKYSDIWYKEHEATSSINTSDAAVRRNLLYFSMFKSVPMIFRKALYNSGHWWSSDKSGEDLTRWLGWYSVLDYLPRITDFSSPKENACIILANDTPHDSHELQAPDYVPVKTVTDSGNTKYSYRPDYGINAAALKRVGTFFNYLKENGVYDNTRIIIVSDHGGTSKETENYDESDIDSKAGRGGFHPTLLVKDFGATGKLTFNRDFMTNADVPLIALDGIVEKPVNPYSGKELKAQKENGIVVTTSHAHMPKHNNKNTFIINDDQLWFVKDNIFDSKNWKQLSPDEIKNMQ